MATPSRSICGLPSRRMARLTGPGSYSGSTRNATLRPMPRYLLERTLGEVTREELDRIAAHSTEIRAERFPQIEWEHTHVIRHRTG